MKVVLLLGSNLGDSQDYLFQANKLLNKHIGEMVCHSSIEQSEAWGFTSETLFFNQVIIYQTDLSPIEVLDACQEIECVLGRVKQTNIDWRTNRTYVDRVIDIDILYYLDNQGNPVTYQDERLQIPHAKIEQRSFVRALLEELNLFRQ